MKKTLALLLAVVTLGACTYSRPIAATSNPIGSKTGTSSQVSLFGLIHFGDGSQITAARNGGISKVSLVDFKNLNILYIYQRHTCVVNGD